MECTENESAFDIESTLNTYVLYLPINYCSCNSLVIFYARHLRLNSRLNLELKYKFQESGTKCTPYIPEFVKVIDARIALNKHAKGTHMV